MHRIQNDQPVETFLAHRTHPAFRIGVGTWGANRGMENLDAFRCKHGIKGSAVLAIVIPNKMRELMFLFRHVPDELARLLNHPYVRRMRGYIGDVDTTCPDLDEKEDVEGLEANGLHSKEIAG